jgi:spermidine synthase
VDDLLTRRLFLYLLFFLSGLTSLVYQILWTRRLTLILGHSVLAVSSVVAVTMAGLALGAFLAGRYQPPERRAYIVLYAQLEAAIGLWALFSFGFLFFIDQLYLTAASWGLAGSPLYLVGLGGSALVLLPPTAAMGATLPLLTGALIDQTLQPGHLVSRLYGINTLGAFCGASLAGFALLPLLGSRVSLASAALLNLLLGFAAYQSAGMADPQPAEKSPEVTKVSLGTGPMVGFGLAGLASMIFQIGWTRSLILSLGSSTYSFAAVLAVFLGGIALGSYLFGLLPEGWARHLGAPQVGALLFGGALCTTVSVLVLGNLPLIFILLFSWTAEQFSRLLLLQVLLVAAVIGPSCLFMGLVFPAIHQAYGTNDKRLGHQVAQFYSANTAGCILGALLAGFVLIPTVGVQWTLKAGILCQVVASFCFLGRSGRLLGGLLTCAVLALPSWNPGLMAAGSGVYSDSQQRLSLAALKREVWRPPTFYKDGISTTVSIHMTAPGEMTVKVNGKVDASLNQTDRKTMYLAGYLGGLFVENPTRAGVIGLGSGMTLEALSHLPTLQQIECAELEPAMLEANKYWSGFNGHVLSDPRVKVKLTDGRTMLRSSKAPYDLIVSEPSNPWIAGVGDLYTREFFSTCRDKLSEKGVMIQWFHFYGVSDQEIAMVFNSFFGAFPHGSVWLSAPGDLLMVGSKVPLEPSQKNFAHWYDETPIMQRRLYEIGLFEVDSIQGLHLLSRQRALELNPTALPNTDDRPLLEYAAPLHLFQQDLVASNLHLLMAHAGSPTGREPVAEAHGWLNFEGTQWARRWLAHNSGTPPGLLLRARLESEHGTVESAQKAYQAAFKEAENPKLVAALWAEFEFRQRRWENAELLYRKAIELGPDWSLKATLQTRLGQVLLARKEIESSVVVLQQAIQDPLVTHSAFTLLAAALTRQGELTQAQETLERSLELNRFAVETHLGLGFLAMRQERFEGAVEAYQKALDLVPDSIEGLTNQGLCLAQLGRVDEAVGCFRTVLYYQPDHPVARHNLQKLGYDRAKDF